MPYNPGASFRGDQYIYGGLNGAGESIARGIESYYLDKQRQAQADTLLNYYLGTGQLTPEQYQAAMSSPAAAREGLPRAIEAEAQRGLTTRGQDLDYYTGEANRAQNYWLEQQRQWQPSAEILEAARKSGYLYLPQSRGGGTYVARPGADGATPALGDDPTGTGNFWFDGSRLKEKRAAPANKPMDAADAALLGAAEKRLAGIQTEMNEHAEKIAANDKRYGFLNLYDREARLAELRAESKGLEARIAAQRGATKPAAASTTAMPPVVEPPLPEKAVTEGTRTAQGGYQIGRKYAGLTYLGGDPNDAASWQQ